MIIIQFAFHIPTTSGTWFFHTMLAGVRNIEQTCRSESGDEATTQKLWAGFHHPERSEWWLLKLLEWAIIAIKVHLVQHSRHFTLSWVAVKIAWLAVKEGWVSLNGGWGQPFPSRVGKTPYERRQNTSHAIMYYTLRTTSYTLCTVHRRSVNACDYACMGLCIAQGRASIAWA